MTSAGKYASAEEQIGIDDDHARSSNLPEISASSTASTFSNDLSRIETRAHATGHVAMATISCEAPVLPDLFTRDCARLAVLT